MLIGFPIDTQVLIELDSVETVSKGGIIITASDKEIERQKMGKETGIIVAMGGNAFKGFGNPSPKLGDRVLFKRYAGTEATLENPDIASAKIVKKMRVMEDVDVRLIIKDVEE
ncbi:MAG: co-chaperone GroES [Candidatus Nucleicultricaceae bacterium]